MNDKRGNNPQHFSRPDAELIHAGRQMAGGRLSGGLDVWVDDGRGRECESGDRVVKERKTRQVTN